MGRLTAVLQKEFLFSMLRCPLEWNCNANQEKEHGCGRVLVASEYHLHPHRPVESSIKMDYSLLPDLEVDLTTKVISLYLPNGKGHRLPFFNSSYYTIALW